MKPRKTRIKVINMTDGTKKYIPQHKRWLNWYDFNDDDGYSILEHTNPYIYMIVGNSLACAQEQIDDYIKAYKKEDIRRKGKDIVNVEYIKYP